MPLCGPWFCLRVAYIAPCPFIDSFAILAFALGPPQAQLGEQEMSDFADKIFDQGATMGGLAVVRRLHFEAITLFLAEKK